MLVLSSEAKFVQFLPEKLDLSSLEISAPLQREKFVLSEPAHLDFLSMERSTWQDHYHTFAYAASSILNQLEPSFYIGSHFLILPYIAAPSVIVVPAR
jgi:hypothetical protein